MSSITGLLGEDLMLGLLMHYLKSDQSQESSIVSYKCGQGRKGHRLDAWMQVTDNCGINFLHQVEVKNWASYSYGGKKIGPNITNDQLVEIAKNNYNLYFKDKRNSGKTLKVLEIMNKPIGFKDAKVTPLIAVWAPVGIHSDLPCYFSVRNDFKNRDLFEDLRVFSASLYVRSLLCSQNNRAIELYLPRVTTRLQMLRDLLTLEANLAPSA